MKLAINTLSVVFKLWLSFIFCIHALNAQITSYPYLEDFESGPGGWTVQGTNTSWELGTPSYVIANAASGMNAWVTDLDGLPEANEYGWVQSPVFDFSGISSTELFLQFNIFVQTITYDDYAYIMVSLDGGATWQPRDATSQDINWYNCPDFQPSWCTTGEWKMAVHSISDLIGQSNVIFGVYFEKILDIYYDAGFAFDDFQISESYCYAGEEEDYYNNDPDSNWIKCVFNGEYVELNTVMDNFLNDTERTPNFSIRRWEFLSGPFGPRGPKIIHLSNDDDDADFPNTGSGSGQLFTFNYIVENGLCEDSVEINLCMDADFDSSYDFKTTYICPGVSILSADEMFNLFSLSQIRDINDSWLDYLYGDPISFPISSEGFYRYFDGTGNELEAEVVELDCSDKDIELSFANAHNTTDGTDDYFEVDVMIRTTTPGSSFKLGDGKLFIRYNKDAFGPYINAYENVEISHPSGDGYIAGQTIDSDPNVNIYASLFPLDNTNGVADLQNITDNDIFRFSWSFRQLYSTSMFAADNVSNTPAKLCHIKIKYEDSSLNPQLEFEEFGIYDNKFTTATICGWVNGGPDITDCTSEPKTLIVNDTFSSVLSTVDYSALNDIVLHPNPSNGTVNVSGNIGSLHRIQVFSVTGALVKQVETALDVIDISNLKSGLYFFKLLGDNATKTVRVIKQ